MPSCVSPTAKSWYERPTFSLQNNPGILIFDFCRPTVRPRTHPGALGSPRYCWAQYQSDLRKVFVRFSQVLEAMLYDSSVIRFLHVPGGILCGTLCDRVWIARRSGVSHVFVCRAWTPSDSVNRVSTMR